TAAPPGGAYQTPQYVKLTSDDPNATLYVARGESEPFTPLSVSEAVYGIAIVEDTLLRYKGIDLMGNESDIRSEHYIIDPDAPEVSIRPAGGRYPHDVTVSFAVYDDYDVAVYYTLDGS